MIFSLLLSAKHNAMKKKCFSALMASMLLLGINQSAVAQKETEGGAKPAFDKGSKTLGFSAGFGVAYGYYASTVNLPAFAVNYDQGIIANVGPGTIGIGGLVGYKSSHYKYPSTTYRANWTNIIIAARATYHLTLLKDKNNKFDPYGGVTAGVRINSYKDTYYNTLPFNPNSYGGVSPVMGVFVGAKYNFTPSFGAFGELGYDISFLRLGLCVNF